MAESFFSRMFGRRESSQPAPAPTPMNSVVQSSGTKAESIRQLVNLGVAGEVKDAFIENVWAYAGVKAISTNISGVPFLIRSYERSGTGKDVTDMSNPFVRLFDDPNPLFDSLQLWKITSIYYETRGQVFWVLFNKNWKPITAGEIPYYIEVADPKMMTPSYNDDRRLVGWKYRRTSSEAQALDLDFASCLRFFEFHPNNLLGGLSPLEVGKISIGIDQKVHLYNDKFFKNGGQITGYLLDENKDSELGETEIQRMREMWTAQYGGLQNAHRTPFLTNGVKFIQTGTNQKDMDFHNLTKIIREEIVGALNVPKSQVGLYEDLNFATAKVADRQFFTNNLIPKMAYFASVINSKLLHKHGLECYFDITTIEALKEDREKKAKVARLLFDLGYSLNEVNVMQDLGMTEVSEEWASIPVNAREEADTVDPNEEDVNGDRKNGADPDTAPDRSSETESGNAASSRNTIADFFFGSENDSGSEQLVSYQKAVVNPFAFLAKPKLVTYFSKLRNLQLKAIDDIGGQITHADIDKVLFDLEKWSDKYMTTVFPFQYDSAMASIKYTIDEAVAAGVDVEAIPSLSSENQQMIADSLTDIYDDGVHTIIGLHRRIRNVLLEAARNDTPIEDVKMAIRQVVKMALSGVNVLAHTEISGAAQLVRWKTMSRIPDAKKKWVSSSDPKTRDSHAAYDSLKAQDMNFEYTLGLKYPGDRRAAPSEFVNCRCHIQLVIER